MFYKQVKHISLCGYESEVCCQGKPLTLTSIVKLRSVEVRGIEEELDGYTKGLSVTMARDANHSAFR